MKICPICCFLLWPPEEAQEFPNSPLAREFMEHSQNIQAAIWLFQEVHRVLTYSNLSVKSYSPHQVSHTGADHHHIKCLFSHDLVKTHIDFSSNDTHLWAEDFLILKYSHNYELLKFDSAVAVTPSHYRGQNLNPSSLFEAISGKICKLLLTASK